MIIPVMIAVFVLGYSLIASEQWIRINKSAIALLMCGALWSIFILFAGQSSETVGADITSALGSACEILVFLIGAMTIVDLIDLHGGFDIITRHITTHSKTALVWLLAGITFVMSAALDNMTTTIIMIMLLRKLIADARERWIYASVIVIAANSGGAWSPIGDVTTIMLWMKGNVSAGRLIASLVLPCMVSVAIPAVFAARMVRGSVDAAGGVRTESSRPNFVTGRESTMIFLLGVVLLLAVPVYKTVTGLPPYMAMIIALGIMWTVTEIMYDKKRGVEESIEQRVSKVLKHIDMPTILFFLGILMAVSALESAGILHSFSEFLDSKVHNVYAIDTLIGVLSSVVDNVPLVAASMGMYPIADAAVADPYTAMFAADGTFWHLLAYSAGVGGSLLIIGSAAGVVAMGLEKINFMWYFKHITLPAFIGYIAGIAVYVCEVRLLGI